jgi:hypothetical protein
MEVIFCKGILSGKTHVNHPHLAIILLHSLKTSTDEGNRIQQVVDDDVKLARASTVEVIGVSRMPKKENEDHQVDHKGKRLYQKSEEAKFMVVDDQRLVRRHKNYYKGFGSFPVYPILFLFR